MARPLSAVNHFPEDPILWAGFGNNPPASSPYWKERHAIDVARSVARSAKTWKGYCQKFAQTFDWIYPMKPAPAGEVIESV